MAVEITEERNHCVITSKNNVMEEKKSRDKGPHKGYNAGKAREGERVRERVQTVTHDDSDPRVSHPGPLDL